MKHITTSDYVKKDVYKSINLYRIYKLQNTAMFVDLSISEAFDCGSFHLEANFGQVWSKEELYQKVKEDLLYDLNYNEPTNRREQYLKVDIKELNKQVAEIIIKEEGLVKSLNSEHYTTHTFTDDIYGFLYNEHIYCSMYGENKDHTPTANTSHGYRDQERDKDFQLLQKIFPDIDFHRSYGVIFEQMLLISAKLETDQIYLDLVSSLNQLQNDLDATQF